MGPAAERIIILVAFTDSVVNALHKCNICMIIAIFNFSMYGFCVHFLFFFFWRCSRKARLLLGLHRQAMVFCLGRSRFLCIINSSWLNPWLLLWFCKFTSSPLDERNASFSIQVPSQLMMFIFTPRQGIIWCSLSITMARGKA